MPQAKTYENRAVCVGPDTPVVDVADQMDAHSVGCVVVVDEEDRPLGILTDRDLTLRVVAAGREPEKTRAADVMSPDVLTGGRRDSTIELLKRLEQRGVRRAPLVEAGHVVGLISLDDLIAELGIQLWNVSEAVSSELREAHRMAARRRRRESREESAAELRQQLGDLGVQMRERIEREIAGLSERLGRNRD
jgi:signal-transduction protein with cAMP-binding, CBS, and nucleotidyltransferase domain